MSLARLLKATAVLFVLPVALSPWLMIYFTFSEAAMPAVPAGPYPGDSVVPDAVMMYDQTRLIEAPPSAVWPWVLQVGKGRG